MWLILLAITLISSYNLVAQPAIHFDSSTIDLGNLPPGRQLRLEIPYTNTGDEPLVIHRIWGSDGGMVFGWNKLPVLPGEQGKVDVSCYTIHRAGYTFRRTMQVITNVGVINVPVVARVCRETDSLK